MKKSVYTILAIATAVFTMSSCSKDDAGSNALNTSVAQQTQTQQPQKVQKNVEFVLYIDSDQPSYIDEAYTIEANGKEMTLDLSKMTEVAPADTAQYMHKFIADKLVENDKTTNNPKCKNLSPRVFKYDLGSFTTGKFTVKSVKRTIKASHPDVAETNFIFGVSFISKQNGVIKDTDNSKAHVFKGVYVNDLQSFLEVNKENGKDVYLNL